jgi:hypothetical protein
MALAVKESDVALPASMSKSSALQIAIVGALSHIKSGRCTKVRVAGGWCSGQAPDSCVCYRTYRISLTVQNQDEPISSPDL